MPHMEGLPLNQILYGLLYMQHWDFGLTLQALVCFSIDHFLPNSVCTASCSGSQLPLLDSWAESSSVCCGEAQNPSPDSTKSPEHTCQISVLVIHKTKNPGLKISSLPDLFKSPQTGFYQPKSQFPLNGLNSLETLNLPG